jgi:hypothetical protein
LVRRLSRRGGYGKVDAAGETTPKVADAATCQAKKLRRKSAVSAQSRTHGSFLLKSDKKFVGWSGNRHAAA